MRQYFKDKTDIKVAIAVDKNDRAEKAARALRKTMSFVPMKEADILLVLGGDGFMLRHFRQLTDEGLKIPIYGMNRGSVGFLLNHFSSKDLMARLQNAIEVELHPLKVTVETKDGQIITAFAFNELSLIRKNEQAAHLNIIIDDKPCLTDMMSDGLVVSTPAGSTAYNFACDGPILPLGASILAMTPISVFRPRRWRGAILRNKSKIKITMQHYEKRPVNAAVDGMLVGEAIAVDVCEDKSNYMSVLFDPDLSLDERIFKEQFMA